MHRDSKYGRDSFVTVARICLGFLFRSSVIMKSLHMQFNYDIAVARLRSKRAM